MMTDENNPPPRDDTWISKTSLLGQMHGLRDAKDAICEYCKDENEPAFNAGAWFHHNVHPRIEYKGCKAGPILDLMKNLESVLSKYSR